MNNQTLIEHIHFFSLAYQIVNYVKKFKKMNTGSCFLEGKSLCCTRDHSEWLG